MANFFHAYDLRGKYPDEISETESKRLGKAYGTYADEKVLVARDGRTHGEKVTEAFIQGITSTGTDVVNAGMVPSPVAYFGIEELGLENGAVVTASHNPSEYTGFKFAKKNALAMSREGGMKQIEKIYESEEFEKGEGEIIEKELKHAYIDSVAEKFDVDLSVVANYGNGAASVVGEELLKSIGCEVTNVNKEIDGSFPNHLPAPHHEDAQNAVKEKIRGQDLGIIFDGDGDRAGFIYNGQYISEDEVLALFSEEILSKKKGKIVHDLRASKLVKERVEKSGGEAIESRVGHTFISEMIHDDADIVFAGELSGHFYFPSLGFPWDDGLIAACLMCEIVDNGRIADLEEYSKYPVSPELRIDCSHENKPTVIREIGEKFSDKEISRKDGVKISFEKGWALIRPSNTEEKMSVRCEADTEKDLEEILDKVESEVRSLC